MPVQVYSFYIFDRHTECVYSKLWLAPPQPGPPASRPVSSSELTVAHNNNNNNNINVQQQQQHATLPQQQQLSPAAAAAQQSATTTAPGNSATSTAIARRAADDAKLVFGTVFSLRNMARKLGGDDDAFISYRTAHYKLHYYETPTNLRFALLTEPGALSMRNVLHQIYINLWVEYVVKNPLSPVEHKGGDGVKNEMFEMGLDKFVRGLM